MKRTAITLSLALLIMSCVMSKEAFGPSNIEVAYIRAIANNDHRVYTEIIINALPSKVWQLLRDFENIGTWSSSLKGITGDISAGGKAVVQFSRDGGKTVDLLDRVLLYDEGKLLGWKANIINPAGKKIEFDHRYIIEPFGQNRTRFIQKEQFLGEDESVNTVRPAKITMKSYQVFNRELKAEVEK